MIILVLRGENNCFFKKNAGMLYIFPHPGTDWSFLFRILSVISICTMFSVVMLIL